MSTNPNMFALRSWGTEQGLSSTDVLMEMHRVSLANGTAVTAPTSIKVGNLIGASVTILGATDQNAAAPAVTISTAGEFQLSVQTAATATFSVLLYARHLY